MTTISIINGIIIQDGNVIIPRECGLGIHVENALEYLSQNQIDMTLSGDSNLVSISVADISAKEKLVKALIDDHVVEEEQLLYSA